MLPKCLKCSNRLSLGWFLGSFIWTKHRCVKCGALHEFTHVHRFAGVIPVVVIIGGMPLLESVIPWFFVRLLAIVLIVAPLILIIPKQHRLSSKDSLDCRE